MNKLGDGTRFEKLTKKLASKPGVSDPKGLAAYIGRKKYGKEKFQQFGQKGKR